MAAIVHAMKPQETKVQVKESKHFTELSFWKGDRRVKEVEERFIYLEEVRNNYLIFKLLFSSKVGVAF